MSKTFNGTTDSISLGSPAALDNIGGSPGSKTIAAYLHLAGWGENDFARIWFKFGSSGWGLLTYNAGGISAARASMKMIVGVDGAAIAQNDTLSLGKWWFVAGTYTPGDGGPRLWIGDQATPVAEVTYSVLGFDARVDLSSYTTDAAETAYIGNQAAGDRTFDGRIAELSVWDGAASLAQLEVLRKGGQANRQTFAGLTLKGYWALQDALASGCVDESGNGNHGTVTGTSVSAGPYPVVSRPRIVQTVSMFTSV